MPGLQRPYTGILILFIWSLALFRLFLFLFKPYSFFKLITCKFHTHSLNLAFIKTSQFIRDYLLPLTFFYPNSDCHMQAGGTVDHRKQFKHEINKEEGK